VLMFVFRLSASESAKLLSYIIMYVLRLLAYVSGIIKSSSRVERVVVISMLIVERVLFRTSLSRRCWYSRRSSIASIIVEPVLQDPNGLPRNVSLMVCCCRASRDCGELVRVLFV
jgi:hypothetical protein